MKKERKLIILVIILTLLLDQMTKIIAFKNESIINKNFDENNGTYIIISILAIIVLSKYIYKDNQFIKNDSKILLSLIISGAMGNLIDRIWYHNVILTINLGNNLALNLAYIYIFIAWIGLAWIFTKNTLKILKDKKGKNKK